MNSILGSTILFRLLQIVTKRYNGSFKDLYVITEFFNLVISGKTV